MIAFLTPALHNFLHNKWYWDELYRAVFVKPAVYFSEVVVYQWIDRGGIDGLLHLIARVFYTIGEWFRRAEIAVFNDAVDWLTFRFRDLGKEFRAFQTGKVQEYALASVLVAVIFTAFIYGASQGWFDGVLFFLAFGN